MSARTKWVRRLAALLALTATGCPVAQRDAHAGTDDRLTVLVPARILDTREGLGAPRSRLQPGAVLDLQVTGRGGVPADGVSAVVLNVTATNTTAPGYLTVWPAGASRPLASNLNFVARQTVPNLVVAGVGPGGRVSIYNSAGATDVVADVSGYYGAAPSPDGGRYRPLAPSRVLDTRDGNGAPRGKLAPGATLDVQVTGRGGVPSGGVSAVALNLTATDPSDRSYLTVWPSGSARPLASNLNFETGQTVPNRVIVAVGSGGRVSMYNPTGTVDVVADVGGWFTDDSMRTARTGALTPVAPARILDTREAAGSPVAADATIDLQVAGRGGLPAAGVAGAILNVTATQPASAGYLTAFPSGSARPLASDLNFVPGLTVANLAVVMLGSDGRARIYNSAGATHVVADVVGWLSGDPSAPPPADASTPAGEAGVCGGAVCGPAGGFTASSFPTVAGVDFSAFPANPARPYKPASGKRAIYAAPGGRAGAAGTQADPLTLPAAVDAARRGDVVWAADGTYTVGPDDDHIGLRLQSPGVTLAAVNPGAASIVARSGDYTIGVDATADDLVVDGFRISGFRDYQVQFGREDSTQQNLVLKHLVTTGGQAGLSSVDVGRTPAEVESCPNTGAGGRPRPVVAGVLVYDAWIQRSTLFGINCGQGPCDDMRLEAIRIQQQRTNSQDSATDGVPVECGDNVLVFNAEVTGSDSDGIDLKSSRSAVVNAYVHDVGRNGIKLWQTGDIVNALVHDTGGDGSVIVGRDTTRVAAPQRFRILNSVFGRHIWAQRTDPSAPGYRPDAGAYSLTAGYPAEGGEPPQDGTIEIVNSISYQNGGPIYLSPRMTVEVRSSLFFGSSDGGEIVCGDVVVDDDSDWQALDDCDGTPGNVSGNRIADPQFASPDADDWSLQAASPGRDAGYTASGMPSFDLFGRQRVTRGTVDIGPIETP